MKRLIVIRGGGEMATGIALTLHTAGFRVLMLERALPSATRREVTFSDAVYDGKKTVERVTCTFTKSKKEAEKLLIFLQATVKQYWIFAFFHTRITWKYLK